jgi:O-antigen ligase
MPEYIRALIAILFIASVIFILFRYTHETHGVNVTEFQKFCRVWFVLVLAGFLSQNYWVFAAIVVVTCHVAKAHDLDSIPLFLFLCLALPQFSVEIPGALGIRYFVNIDYLRILTLMFLLPVCFREYAKAKKNKLKTNGADILIAIYFVYTTALSLRHTDVIGFGREVFNFSVDVIIPYYAISRSLKTLADIQKALLYFVMGGTVIAALAAFEYLRSWLLYSSHPQALGQYFSVFYLGRAGSIRAQATSGQAIVLGYTVGIVLLCYCSFFRIGSNKKQQAIVLFILAFGTIASLSKGPWVGLAFGLLVLLFTSENLFRNLLKSLTILIPIIVAMVTTDVGNSVMGYLPFVGTVDEGSATFRQLLFDESIKIILDYPIFGSTDYLPRLEILRNGSDGIIDVTNTYISIALNFGLLGLLIFILFFTVIIVRIGHRMGNSNADYHQIGRILISIIIFIAFTITIVSSIFHVPFLYWVFAAVAVAYTRISDIDSRRKKRY